MMIETETTLGYAALKIAWGHITTEMMNDPKNFISNRMVGMMNCVASDFRNKSIVFPRHVNTIWFRNKPAFEPFKKNTNVRLLEIDSQPATGMGYLEMERLFRYVEELTIRKWNIVSFPLNTRLTSLQLHEMPGIQFVPDLRGLPLKSLHLCGLDALIEIPNIQGLPLEELILIHLKLINKIPDVQGLPLKKLSLGYMENVDKLPDVTGLPLTHLGICCMRNENLTEIPDLTGLPLKRLTLILMPYIKTLPKLTGLLQLETIQIESLYRITEVPDLDGLPLINIVIRSLWYAVRIPQLSRPTLKVWSVYDMRSLQYFSEADGLRLQNLRVNKRHISQVVPNTERLRKRQRITE
jgi:hypothetical protein